MSLQNRILEIEQEMARTQKNKNTEGHLGLLKAKVAKLRKEQVDAIMVKGGGHGEGFDVIKSGDARIGLIGFPSVGKSTLLTKLTDTFSEVNEREFTTLTCIPGVIQYRGSKLQLLDLPGIIEGAKDGRGKGRQVIGVARTCNLILVILDAVKPLSHKRIIENELEGVGIKLNRKKPDISKYLFNI
jgi:small GTP-binding protein